jgi:hypothetical protein
MTNYFPLGTRYAGTRNQYDLLFKAGVLWLIFLTSGEWRPASKEIMAEEGFPETKAQAEARSKHSAETIRAYREAQSRRTPEEIAEQAYELRAAFGPGVEVVNVLTGKLTRT